jgi:hypothetical protein
MNSGQLKRLIIVCAFALYYAGIRTFLYWKVYDPSHPTEFLWWWSWVAAIPISFLTVAVPLLITAFIIGPKK